MSGPLALGFVNDFRPSPGVCFVVASGSHHLCSPRPSCSAPRDPRALTRLRAPLKARRGLRLEVVISVAARLAVSVFFGENSGMVTTCQGLCKDLYLYYLT